MLGELVAVGVNGNTDDIWSDYVLNGGSKNYTDKNLQEENVKRKNYKCTSSDGLSFKEFKEIVIHECEQIAKELRYAVDGAIVFITIKFVDGVSENYYELDFNDYGKITGRYWIMSDNDDLEIPLCVAERISKKIQGIEIDDACNDCEDLKEEGICIERSPEPITDKEFDEIIKAEIKAIGEYELGWFTLAYEPKREDNITAIQTCIDEAEEGYRVEIVVDEQDGQPFHIYAKDALERVEVLSIFYNVCVRYNFQNLNDWKDVTNSVKYV